jgi:two-component system, chemotaxis family, sensor kinase CheA
MDDVDEVVGEFLVESYENLEQLDADFVALEKDPAERETLARVFRTIHTIKGTCGFLAFGRLEALTHTGENLLSSLRDGTLTLDSAMTTALLAMVDAVRVMLADIERTGSDGVDDYSELIDRLAELQEPKPEPAITPPVDETVEPAITPPVFKIAEPSSMPRVGEILAGIGAVQAVDISIALAEQALGDKRPIGEILVEHGALDAEVLRDVLRLQNTVREGVEAKASVSDSTIRVDVGLLDRLMSLVGELVLSRNNILQRAEELSDPLLQTASQRLHIVTGELQESAMRARMQAISTVWSKYPRVVRDLSLASGKQVRIETVGQDTELDKTIIEAIRDPLTHIVRNSIDHGIELPEARLAAGKPAEGLLHMRARQEGGQVIIEITDDGAGIQVSRVKAKAVGKGLLTAEHALTITDRDAMQLIFAPGFSTAEAITNVSGRGVGMDVVRTNIEKIGGAVDVASTPGVSTTVSLRIPLTLAIVPALLVVCDDVRYAIPQVDVLELVHLAADRLQTAIEWFHNVPVYRLRGNLLPLVYLREQLSLSPAGESDSVTIAVSAAGDQSIGLVVDSVVSSEEIVVKPLGQLLVGNPAFSGATILGDGRVALILDVLGIAERSGVIDVTNAHAVGNAATGAAVAHNRTSLLVVTMGTERAAIPLADVARLEKISRSSIERSGGRDLVQYRGSLLPIIGLSELIGGAVADTRDPASVIVHDFRGQSIGIVVDTIVDIVETDLTTESGQTSDVVVAGRITQIVDIKAVLEQQGAWLTDAVQAVPA